MEDVVIQVGRFIGHLLFELLWYYTAKLVLPLASFGFCQVQPLSAKHQAAWWWQRPFRRLPSGHVEVSAAMAAFLGFLIWGVLLLGIVLRYGSS